MNTQGFKVETHSKLPAGYLIGDRYKVKAYIGSGASGTVYQCTDTTLGTLSVAVKIFPKWVSTDKKRAKRIHRELRACNRVNHENVVRFYDTIYDESVLGYSMEYVDGSPLDRLVEPSGTSDFSLIGSFIRQLLLGVQSIHEAGIIHRDLKPENIIVSKDMILKVADFGLVSSWMEASDAYFSTIDKNSNELIETTKTTGAGHIVGTPAYMAPETVSNRSYDIRSDLYSIGVIAYELVTGRIPFETLPCYQLLLAKVELETPSVKSLRSDCPEELAEFIYKLLIKDPDQRFQNSAEALDAILKFQRNKQVLDQQAIKISSNKDVLLTNLNHIFNSSEKYTNSFCSEFVAFVKDFSIPLEGLIFIVLTVLILAGVFNSNTEPELVEQPSKTLPNDNSGKSRFFGPQNSKNNVIVVRPE